MTVPKPAKSIRPKRDLIDNNLLKLTVPTDHASQITTLRQTGKRLGPLFCFFLRYPLFGNFHKKKKMWTLKVLKDGHEPHTFPSF